MRMILTGGRSAVFIAAASIAVLAGPAEARQSDAQIKKEIIRQSIANYSGNCPCPYSIAANGSRCGGRSAYSRPGGASPICYPSDVTQAELNAYRRR